MRNKTVSENGPDADNYVLTLVAPAHFGALNQELLTFVQSQTGVNDLHILVEDIAVDLRGIQPASLKREDLKNFLNTQPIDWCLQPEAGRRKKLLISDMDSTIIGQECIDELAAYAGIGEKVAAITERAMRGELDFAASLTERVALLAGLDSAIIESVLKKRITLNAGTKALVATMRRDGAYTMLVSGGFTVFSERVASMAGFEAHHANTLEIHDQQIAGKVTHPILDKHAKRHLLDAALKRQSLDASESVAVGDGANDAEMIEAAGLGIAFRAKPYLQSRADASITHTDLTTVLYFQGYHAQEIIQA